MIRAVLAFALLAAPAAAEPVLSPDTKELLTELGAAANMAGMCERFMPDRDAAEILDTFRDIDGKPGRSEADDFVAPLLLDLYAQGRASPTRLKLDADACGNLLRDQGERVGALRKRLEAER